MVPPVPRDPPDVLTPGEPKSWLLRFGGIVGAGAFGSAMAATPAALRLQGTLGSCSPMGAWPFLFGVAIVPMTLVIVGVRRARTGFRALGRSDGMTPVVLLLAWLASCFSGMTLLGALLRARTHHRALGGVVFGFLALVMALGLAVVLVRVASIVRRTSSTMKWALMGIAAAGLGFVVAFTRHRLAQGGSSPFSPDEGAKLIDGLAFALSAFIASGHPIAQRRAIALAGPPLATILVILGASSWRTCPMLGQTLDEQAPLFGWIAHRAAMH